MLKSNAYDNLKLRVKDYRKMRKPGKNYTCLQNKRKLIKQPRELNFL
jgi:hypothetical protein